MIVSAVFGTLSSSISALWKEQENEFAWQDFASMKACPDSLEADS